LSEQTVNKRVITDEREELNDPAVDVLTEGWLHKVMLFFHVPAEWPAWLVVVSGLLLTIAVGGIWMVLLDHALAASLVMGAQFAFLALDMVILASLPRRGLSYGPWKAQFFVLALPRLMVTIALSITAVWWNWQVALALVVFVQALGTIALWHGAVIEPFKLEMTEYHMFTDRMAYGTPPVRILHITDLHIERLTKRETKLLEFVRTAKPDLILISGDYVNLSYNRDPETLRQVKQLLSQLEAPYGVFATLGSPPVDLRETVPPIFDDLPIPLLRAAWQKVDLEDGRYLTLIGMDCTHHLPTDAERLANLMASAPNSVPQVLLYHSPEMMPRAVDYGIDLYLCGHTHGGQVRLPLIGPLLTSSQLGRQFVMGIYRVGRTHLYVSRGVGLEGMSAPRVRFGAPPEITLVVMHARGKPEGMEDEL
jgi:uncharacterized protein